MGSLMEPRRTNPYALPLKANEYAPAPTPSLEEWHQLWKIWDLVTRDMISEQNLHDKPIQLRNCLLFYLGHIPTFEDIHLSRALKAEATPPALYQDIFERGIDPDVDNPEHCHDHSEIPDKWPALNEILYFQHKVRQRITFLYKNGRSNDRVVQRALWIGFEHEALHLETFLYMTIQSNEIKPPPGLPRPDFQAMAVKAQGERVENQWIEVPTSEVILGINPTDLEDETVGPERYYGWDNERPIRHVTVTGFEAKARPITNGEYASYLADQSLDTIPASWVTTEPISLPAGISPPDTKLRKLIEDKAIRTVYGPVPVALAQDWPVMASFNELDACAKWLGGSIPTYEQVRSISQHVESQKQSTSPPNSNYATDKGKPNPLDVFVDMEGQNVGFNYFHPTPVTQYGSVLQSGLGGLGGAWEQTSTPLAHFDGFKAMDIYPGYTADFFDGKHNIVIGGSWATHPRITGRKSFMNWWQRKYIYPWVTARIVRPISIST